MKKPTEDDDDDDENGDPIQKENDIDSVSSSTTMTKNSGWEDVPNGYHILPLDETNFHETINGNSCVMVLFYAKWCGACAPLKPVYAHVASTLNDRCCIPAAVDCTSDFSIADRCNVDHLPTIKLYVNGVPSNDYDGDRSPKDLRKFAVLPCTVVTHAQAVHPNVHRATRKRRLRYRPLINIIKLTQRKPRKKGR